MLIGRTNRRTFIAALGSAAAWPLVGRGQQPTMPVVGFLNSTSPAPWAYLVAAFRRGLGEAGYVEDRNVAIEYQADSSDVGNGHSPIVYIVRCIYS